MYKITRLYSKGLTINKFSKSLFINNIIASSKAILNVGLGIETTIESKEMNTQVPPSTPAPITPTSKDIKDKDKDKDIQDVYDDDEDFVIVLRSDQITDHIISVNQS